MDLLWFVSWCYSPMRAGVSYIIESFLGSRHRGEKSTILFELKYFPGKAGWKVHGLWPNRYGEVQPLYCDKSWLYEDQEMEPIRAELEQFWPDHAMRKVDESLWSHEWSKHGTCAVSSAPESNITNQTEYFRYFMSGLPPTPQYYTAGALSLC